MFNSRSLIMLCIMVLPLFLSKTEAQVCGVDWQVVNPLNIKDVIYGNGQLVAVGDNGVILTSTDGKDWLPLSSGVIVTLRSVIWSGNKFMVVGDDNTILTSTDGENWSKQFWLDKSLVGLSDLNWHDITWANDQFVIVGNHGTILTSHDGEIWTKADTDIDINSLVTIHSVAWGNNQFVAVVDNKTILTSPDGIAWASHQYERSLIDIIYTGNQFIAIGKNKAIVTSPDAIHWTIRNPGPVNRIDYDHNQLVAVGNTGSISTSNDAIIWIKQSSPTTENLYGITWDGNNFVAMGTNSAALISQNALTWTELNLNKITDVSLPSIIWVNNQFVAVGSNNTDDIILTSADAITWNQTIWDDPDSDYRSYMQDVTWGNNQFVAVGKKYILTSPDAKTWTKVFTLKNGHSLSGVTWNGEQFIAIGTSLIYGLICTSLDGVTWMPCTQVTERPLKAIVWGRNQFVAVGDKGTILSSPDAITWTVRDSTLTSYFENVSWDGKQFMVVGLGSKIAVSTDAIHWNTINSSIRYSHAITHSNNQMLAVGDGIITSWPGTENFELGIEKDFKDVVWNGNQFVVIGKYSNIILRSPCDATATNPQILIAQASNITQHNATIKAVIGNAQGADTEVVFEYGLTSTYGNSIHANPASITAGAAYTQVTAQLSHLACGQGYHYRTQVTDAINNKTYSKDAYFSTMLPTITVGRYAPISSVFYLMRDDKTLTFNYGPGGQQALPIIGDWNGDSSSYPSSFIPTIGIYNLITSTFALRNSNYAGAADITFEYGPRGQGWLPIAGDWNGDGIDTVGLYDPATGWFHLRNSNTSGVADVTFAFDAVPIGLQSISGDWDGNGGDNVGLYDAMQHKFYLRNSNTAGPADIMIDFNSSQSNWLPVAGDFNSDCITTVGLYDPLQSKFHIRNSNSSGAADAIISVTPTGGRSWLPIASR